MKNVFIIIFLLTASRCILAQQKIQVDSKRMYTVAREGVIDLIGTSDNFSDTVKSNIILNGNRSHILEYGKAHIKVDTLIIEFMNYDPAWDNHVFKLIILQGSYSVDYTFFSVLDQIPKNRIFKTINSQVILNTHNIKKGVIVRGFINYEGKCVKGCEDNKSPMICRLQGNFSIMVP